MQKESNAELLYQGLHEIAANHTLPFWPPIKSAQHISTIDPWVVTKIPNETDVIITLGYLPEGLQEDRVKSMLKHVGLEEVFAARRLDILLLSIITLFFINLYY